MKPEEIVMFRDKFKNKIMEMLSHAGVVVNGERPWDLAVRNDRFYTRILSSGSLGLGESYMDGWWECKSIDQFICKILQQEIERRIKTFLELPMVLKARICNQQKISRAFQVGLRHYDIGNDLYQAMLDKRMIYSCAYWEKASNLDEAQENKLELVCRKLDLQPGMKVLDIGCGWGGAARYMANRYKVAVTGITVSKEQAKLATELCRGVPVNIRLLDYRNLNNGFDRIFSLGMFEHVGYKNYPVFMQVARRCLRKDGLFLLHTIGSNVSKVNTDPWLERYIFPNSMLPSVKQIGEAISGIFIVEDWHNFGADYDNTLMHWFQNFDRQWDGLKEKYGERFYRMWKYYLLSCAGSFRARKNQVWQIVLAPEGVPGGYRAPWREG